VKGSRFMHMERVVEALLNGGNGGLSAATGEPRVPNSETGVA
jgi:hypothetical protein